MQCYAAVIRQVVHMLPCPVLQMLSNLFLPYPQCIFSNSCATQAQVIAWIFRKIYRRMMHLNRKKKKKKENEKKIWFYVRLHLDFVRGRTAFTTIAVLSSPSPRLFSVVGLSLRRLRATFHSLHSLHFVYNQSQKPRSSKINFHLENLVINYVPL